MTKATLKVVDDKKMDSSEKAKALSIENSSKKIVQLVNRNIK